MPRSNLEQAAEDFACYCGAVDPQFEYPWHIRRMVNGLEAIERNDFDRLIESLPPRHGKTSLSQRFAAWYLGRHPDRSVIVASYGAELANDSGRRIRQLINDPIHHAVFRSCAISGDSDSVSRFHLTAGGAFFATGVGGPLTGRGGNLIIVDDALKNAEDARSATVRRNLQDWYQHVLYPRLEPGGAIVIIGTRWHQDDLTGWLLREHASEAWKVINLPAIAEENEGFRDAGEALWPERFPLETLQRIREAIGSAAWNSLYMGRPAPETGAVFDRRWWRSYVEPPKCRRVIFAIDTAFSIKSTADFSVVEVWGEFDAGYALLHVMRQRLEFPALKAKTEELAAIWRPTAVLIEDAASGQSLIQSLRTETRLPIIGIKTGGSDKIARATAVTPLCESGRVFLPQAAPWLDDFLDELTSFPAAPHDDQADALSMALNYLRGEGRRDYAYTPGPPEFAFYPEGDRMRRIMSGEWSNPNSPHFLTKVQREDLLDDMLSDAIRKARRSGRGLLRKGYAY